MITRVRRQEIREALEAGLKAPEIMELLQITHAQVTRERKYLGIGKWKQNKRKTRPSTYHLPSTIEKMKKIRDMLLESKTYVEIRDAIKTSKDTIALVKDQLKLEGYKFGGRGVLLNPGKKMMPEAKKAEWRKRGAYNLADIDFSPTPSITKDDIGATITVGPAPTREITPMDYVSAFEQRVLEFHTITEDASATVTRLKQEKGTILQELTDLRTENRKLRDQLTQAIYQQRNWQPNSLIRTSLANGG